MRVRGLIGFGLIDLLRRTNVLPTLRMLEADQWIAPEMLKRLSHAKALAHFERMRKQLPYYAKYANFEDIPITTKDIVRASSDGFLNKSIPESHWVRKKTGGSTGEPFVYFTSRRTQTLLWAGILLSWKTAGYELGDPVGFVAGSSVFGEQGWKQRLYYRLMNVDLYSAFDMSADAMTSYLNSMRQRHTRLLYGYGSAIHRLAIHARQHGMSIPSLRACVTTAELLTPGMRTDIEAALACSVFDQYGVNDAGVSAYECERHKGLHLIVSRCFHEVTDCGVLLSTDLTNDVMPLLRYDTGDRVRLSVSCCDCGRGYPMIEAIDGRSNDGVVAEDGTWVHSEFFTHMFREESSIRRFQVIQRENKAIEIRIDGSVPPDTETFERALRRRLGTVAIEWRKTPEFLLTDAGKARFVISKVRAQDVAVPRSKEALQ